MSNKKKEISDEQLVIYTVDDVTGTRKVSGIHSPLIKQLARIETPDIPDLELLKRVKEGDESGSFLLLCKHYKYILAKVIEATNGTFFSEDILQAGIVGLYEAARRFDFNYHNKFLTYAHSWIIKYIYIEMRKELLPLGGIKIGRDTQERLYNYIKYKMQGYTDEQIKEKLHIKDHALKDLKVLNSVASRMRSLDTDSDKNALQKQVVYDVSEQLSPEKLALASEFTRYLEKSIDGISDYSVKASVFLNYELGLNGYPILEKHALCKTLEISPKEYDNIKHTCHKYLQAKICADGWLEGDLPKCKSVESLKEQLKKIV